MSFHFHVNVTMNMNMPMSMCLCVYVIVCVLCVGVGCVYKDMGAATKWYSKKRMCHKTVHLLNSTLLNSTIKNGTIKQQQHHKTVPAAKQTVTRQYYYRTVQLLSVFILGKEN